MMKIIATLAVALLMHSAVQGAEKGPGFLRHQRDLQDCEADAEILDATPDLGSCLGDRYNSLSTSGSFQYATAPANKRTPGCTANDVRVAFGTPVAGQDPVCAQGEIVTRDMILTVEANANERYDVAAYVAYEADRKLYATRTLRNFDLDTCGDVAQNTQYSVKVCDLSFPCTDTNGNGVVDVWVCTTWSNNANTRTCPRGAAPAPIDFLPDTTSKCKCESVPFGLTVCTPATGTCANTEVTYTISTQGAGCTTADHIAAARNAGQAIPLPVNWNSPGVWTKTSDTGIGTLAGTTMDGATIASIFTDFSTTGTSCGASMTVADVTTGELCNNLKIERTYTLRGQNDVVVSWCKRTFNIRHTIPPTIAAPPSLTLCFNQIYSGSNTATLSQYCVADSPLSPTSDPFPTSGTQCGTGPFTRNWAFTDACGNAATPRSQTLTFKKGTLVITGVPPVDRSISPCVDAIPALPTGISATNEECPGDSSITANCACSYSAGSITRTWSANDGCNSASDEYRINFIDGGGTACAAA